MNRFFLPAGSLSNGKITFTGDLAHQVRSVLRLKSGETVIVLENDGLEHIVEVSVTPGLVEGVEIGVQEAAGESATRLCLFLCLTQREKFEWMLQKCTELGAAEFTPVISRRSLVQSIDDVEKKLPRWRKIVQEAAEQSGRGLLPLVHEAQRFAAALDEARPPALSLIPWEKEETLTLRSALQSHVTFGAAPRVNILIGPEGGFDDDEVSRARSTGWLPLTLGRRILRMETAAVTVAAQTIYELG